MNDLAWSAAGASLRINDLAWSAAGDSLRMNDFAWSAAGASLTMNDLAWSAAGASLRMNDLAWRTAGARLRMNDLAWRTAGASLRMNDLPWSTAGDSLRMNDLAWSEAGDCLRMNDLAWSAAGDSLRMNDLAWSEAGDSLRMNDLAWSAADASLRMNDLAFSAAGASLRINDLAWSAAGDSLRMNDLAWSAAGASLRMNDLAWSAAGARLRMNDLAWRTAGARLRMNDLTWSAAGDSLRMNDLAWRVAGDSLRINDLAWSMAGNSSRMNDLAWTMAGLRINDLVCAVLRSRWVISISVCCRGMHCTGVPLSYTYFCVLQRYALYWGPAELYLFLCVAEVCPVLRSHWVIPISVCCRCMHCTELSLSYIYFCVLQRYALYWGPAELYLFLCVAEVCPVLRSRWVISISVCCRGMPCTEVPLSYTYFCVLQMYALYWGPAELYLFLCVAEVCTVLRSRWVIPISVCCRGMHCTGVPLSYTYFCVLQMYALYWGPAELYLFLCVAEVCPVLRSRWVISISVCCRGMHCTEVPLSYIYFCVLQRYALYWGPAELYLFLCVAEVCTVLRSRWVISISVYCRGMHCTEVPLSYIYFCVLQRYALYWGPAELYLFLCVAEVCPVLRSRWVIPISVCCRGMPCTEVPLSYTYFCVLQRYALYWGPAELYLFLCIAEVCTVLGSRWVIPISVYCRGMPCTEVPLSYTYFCVLQRYALYWGPAELYLFLCVAEVCTVLRSCRVIPISVCCRGMPCTEVPLSYTYFCVLQRYALYWGPAELYLFLCVAEVCTVLRSRWVVPISVCCRDMHCTEVPLSYTYFCVLQRYALYWGPAELYLFLCIAEVCTVLGSRWVIPISVCCRGMHCTEVPLSYTYFCVLQMYALYWGPAELYLFLCVAEVCPVLRSHWVIPISVCCRGMHCTEVPLSYTYFCVLQRYALYWGPAELYLFLCVAEICPVLRSRWVIPISVCCRGMHCTEVPLSYTYFCVLQRYALYWGPAELYLFLCVAEVCTVLRSRWVIPISVCCRCMHCTEVPLSYTYFCVLQRYALYWGPAELYLFLCIAEVCPVLRSRWVIPISVCCRGMPCTEVPLSYTYFCVLQRYALYWGPAELYLFLCIAEVCPVLRSRWVIPISVCCRGMPCTGVPLSYTYFCVVGIMEWDDSHSLVQDVGIEEALGVKFEDINIDILLGPPVVWDFPHTIPSIRPITWGFQKRTGDRGPVNWNFVKQVAEQGTVKFAFAKQCPDGTIIWSFPQQTSPTSTINWKFIRQVPDKSTINWNFPKQTPQQTTIKWTFIRQLETIKKIIWGFTNVCPHNSTINWNFPHMIIDTTDKVPWRFVQLVPQASTISWKFPRQTSENTNVKWHFINNLEGTPPVPWGFTQRLKDDERVKWTFSRQSGTKSTVPWFQGHMLPQQAATAKWSFQKNLSMQSTRRWNFTSQTKAIQPINWNFVSTLASQQCDEHDHDAIRRENQVSPR